MVISPLGLGIKNQCIGEAQQKCSCRELQLPETAEEGELQMLKFVTKELLPKIERTLSVL
jgi:hypothetical protein